MDVTRVRRRYDGEADFIWSTANMSDDNCKHIGIPGEEDWLMNHIERFF